MSKKILFAVGGTGGHLFPAQALARQLRQDGYEILFAGGRLGSNPFFHKLSFPFRDISSQSPFRSQFFKAGLHLLKGVRESHKLLSEFSPDCIIGFGSFYSFPILAAARIKKIPYILVESNAFPGKVNRLFSSKALVSAIQFEEASTKLKGNIAKARMPLWSEENPSAFLETQSARKYFGLDPFRFTLLIFGGSGGANALNQASSFLKEGIQVLHFCGKENDPKQLRDLYKKQNISAIVKPFEEKMHIAWRSADLALCRSGAGTLNELIAFQVPAILVPWPGASENHQYKNAQIFENKNQAILLNEKELYTLPQALEKARQMNSIMRENLMEEAKNQKTTLSTLVKEQLEKL